MAATMCWDQMKCGKEKACPAYPNRGFECWNVPGTLCRGEIQGSYGEKIELCRTKCEYYTGVISGTIRVC
ncbi:MAG: two-CW domain-containing protein [Thermodesulfobacteriota bacterium]